LPRFAIRIAPALAALLLCTPAAPAGAQALPTDDPVIQAIWEEGTTRSRAFDLAQVLMDSIGPRLAGSPQIDAAHAWLVATYRGLGIDARNERYGTWKGWRRGHTHADLVRPWTKSLDAQLVAWSPGTTRPVEAPVITLPASGDPTTLAAWRRDARGKFVLAAVPEPSCRPVDEWQRLATPGVFARFSARRDSVHAAWRARLAALNLEPRELPEWLEAAGVAGILTSDWSGGYGAYRVFGATLQRTPMVALSCEDFGLLSRLAERRQGPVFRLDARAEALGDVPVFNTIAVIPGTERPEEYVLLSAHIDSWGAATGATDNGTGTIVALEAMRLLKAAYPNPKRTIIAGHWGGEEQGLHGSRAWAADNPQIVARLQAVFNQDNGTGPVTSAGMSGFIAAGQHFARWLAPIPGELSDRVQLRTPGSPFGGGSDHAAFICHGAPGFSLWSDSWDYSRYTWHTNLDTFDKIAFDNVQANAILYAMLAYGASEDPEFLPRDRAVLRNQQGELVPWPACGEPQRQWRGYRR
jgi:carboxypeptidase Q